MFSVGTGPYGIDIGQVREFGVDAVATAHAEANAGAIFFRKHQDFLCTRHLVGGVLIATTVGPSERPRERHIPVTTFTHESSQVRDLLASTAHYRPRSRSHV